MGKPKIFRYASIAKSYREVIVPSVKNIPQWYKDIKKLSPSDSFNQIGKITKNVKSCTPFLDSLSVGYQMVLPYDLEVVNVNGQVNFTWTQMETPVPVTLRNSDSQVPIPLGCDTTHFAWHCPAFINIEKGHSFLVTHPLNRHDLPFITLSGIVDGGWSMYDGNFPFFVKEGFTGTIHQGTPIAQVIPFKNDEWKAIEDLSIVEEGQSNFFKTQLTFSHGFYKKTYWQRKSYE